MRLQPPGGGGSGPKTRPLCSLGEALKTHWVGILIRTGQCGWRVTVSSAKQDSTAALHSLLMVNQSMRRHAPVCGLLHDPSHPEAHTGNAFAASNACVPGH